MLENIVMSKLYRAGSVVSASKSGGMSKELNKFLPGVPMDSSRVLPLVGTDALEVVFLDHMLHCQDALAAMILLRWARSVAQIEAVKSGNMTKPVIGWCVGTCASCFAPQVQFGHAGAQAGGDSESVTAKTRP